jgi:glycosyltransferase involved in cell wall biosynthesis
VRLLVLTPQYPFPPHQGTTIRNYNIIRQLASRHDIHLLSFAESTCRDSIERMRPHCTSICTVPAPIRKNMTRARDTFLSPLPDMALRLESADMRQQLRRLLVENAYDVVQVEGIEMGPYLLQVDDDRGRGGAAPLIVFDDHNCEYALQRRAFQIDMGVPRRWAGATYSLIQWKKLTRYERRCCIAADRIVAVSEKDGSELRRLQCGLKVSIVPNGVDIETYDPAEVKPVALGPAAIVFTGKMDFRPNLDGVLWFANRVLPLILSQVPEAHFYVVGQQPHARLDSLRCNPAVTITGFVPRSPPYIAAAAVYVVPLRMGGGTRLKILESMALGKAVVSTSFGFEGFPLMRPGEHLCVEDGDLGFAHAVVDLLRDPTRRQALGKAARRLVTANYDWAGIAASLEDVYTEGGLPHRTCDCSS